MSDDALRANAVRVFIGVGANLGAREQTVCAALLQMRELPASEVVAVSSLYASAPVGEGATGERYINAVVQLATHLPPTWLLSELQTIEQAFGRVRVAGQRNAPRTLDLDVLLYGDEVLHSTSLQLPHPRMHERAFVLLPLHEIAPNLRWVSGVGEHGVAECLTTVAEQDCARIGVCAQ